MLLPSGRALTHSLVVAVPFSGVVLAIARRYGKPTLGVAFAIGYLSHLATDAVARSPGGSTSVESVFWPIVGSDSSTDPPRATGGGRRDGNQSVRHRPRAGHGRPDARGGRPPRGRRAGGRRLARRGSLGRP
ncbi:metal-dependent hydrolase [Halosolutus halophilus]|uniref:metal-dependent hydrolase n=1 Tax=Halosolutus halophilus TaxID=1552990 RepID=UPI003CE4A536